MRAFGTLPTTKLKNTLGDSAAPNIENIFITQNVGSTASNLKIVTLDTYQPIVTLYSGKCLVIQMTA